MTRVNPNEIDVPIIGGHSEKTIFPVLNSVKNLKTGKKIDLTDDQKISLYHDIRNAGDKVLQAYDSKVIAFSLKFDMIILKKTILILGF